MPGISLGSTDVDEIFIGATPIESVYFGATKAWPNDTPPASVFWDPAHKGSAVTISGGGLVATVSGGEGNVSASLFRNAATAHHYFELTENSATLFASIGIMREDSTSFDSPLGTNDGQVGVYNNSGFFFYTDAGTGFQASGSPSGMAFGATDTPCGYLESGSLWLGVVGSGWWDTDSGTFVATPADAEPFMTGITGNWAPATSNGFGGDDCQMTGTFKAPFAGSIPSGGAAWDS